MYDIVIVGSGPAGLSAAIYAQRENLKAVVVEKEFMGTGQIAESERVDNYPGLYGETGFDLGEKFRTHAEKLGAEFVEGEVTEVERVNGNFSVNIDGGESLETKTVIYAAGTQRRKLGVKGEKEFSGNGVSYCAVCDAAFYKDKITVVTGGGDTALGDALLLSRFCKRFISFTEGIPSEQAEPCRTGCLPRKILKLLQMQRYLKLTEIQR